MITIFINKQILTSKPDVSEYFFGGLKEGGAVIFESKYKKNMTLKSRQKKKNNFHTKNP